MANTPPIKLKVEIDASKLGKVIADAIEENMALPVCDREHVEPMAEWEKDLLLSVTVPRVVKDRSEFRVGQTIAFAMGSVAAIARVTAADGQRVVIDGRYLNNPTAYVSSPFSNEIARGYWTIVADPEVGR